jgi:hypothetical protein
MKISTWRQIFPIALALTKDSLDDLTFNTQDANDLLDKEFNSDYGSAEGQPFVAWSKDYVYFSRDYDGLDYVDFVERNPK